MKEGGTGRRDGDLEGSLDRTRCSFAGDLFLLKKGKESFAQKNKEKIGELKGRGGKKDHQKGEIPDHKEERFRLMALLGC